HLLHQHVAEASPVAVGWHWLRDSSLMIPAALVAVVLADRSTRGLRHRRLLWAAVTGSALALLSLPGNVVHAWLFVGAIDATSGHLGRDATVVLAAATGIALLLAR